MYRAVRPLPTHDRGMCAVDTRERIGLLRVPKCASTSITQRLGLVKWVSVADFRPKPVLLAYRDPLERFLSSIPETLLRSGAHKSDRSGDVQIPLELYEELHQIDVGSPVHLVSEMLSLIERNGFFDPHHEPQVNFIFDEDGEPFANYIMFNVIHTNEVLNFAEKKWGVGQVSRRNRNMRARAGVLGLVTSRSIFVAGLAERLRRSHGIIYYDSHHPVSRITGNSGSVPFRMVEAQIGSYYRSCLRGIDLDDEVEERIQGLYRSDFELIRKADSLCQRTDPFVQMSDVLHR